MIFESIIGDLRSVQGRQNRCRLPKAYCLERETGASAPNDFRSGQQAQAIEAREIVNDAGGKAAKV